MFTGAGAANRDVASRARSPWRATRPPSRPAEVKHRTRLLHVVVVAEATRPTDRTAHNRREVAPGARRTACKPPKAAGRSSRPRTASRASCGAAIRSRDCRTPAAPPCANLARPTPSGSGRKLRTSTRYGLNPPHFGTSSNYVTSLREMSVLPEYF